MATKVILKLILQFPAKELVICAAHTLGKGTHSFERTYRKQNDGGKRLKLFKEIVPAWFQISDSPRPTRNEFMLCLKFGQRSFMWWLIQCDNAKSQSHFSAQSLTVTSPYSFMTILVPRFTAKRHFNTVPQLGPQT